MLSLWPRVIWPVLFVPTTSFAWSPGVISPPVTHGFSVDASDRNDVVSFYQAVYMASEGYQDRVGWTGNYSSVAAGAEGTVSTVFAGDVERRLNFIRALAGVKADTRVNTGATVNIVPGDAFEPVASTTKAAAAQRSALMIIRTYPGNGGLSHNPAQSCTAWTAAAWNANRNGNLALGYFGPGAVDAYAKEDVMGTSNWNIDVGHRRWLLYQWSTDFATGDTPGSFTPGTNAIRPPSNAMYVVPKLSEVDFSPLPAFVAYPTKGYCPAKFNSPYWSLSYPAADFSAATVSMSDSAGSPVPVSVVSRRTGFGDNSIVWQVPAAAAVKSVSSDTKWNVTVSNIGGIGVPSQCTYSVTLIDPDQLNQVPVITGTPTPSTVGATYQLPPMPGVDKVQVGLFLRKAATWAEGAEDGAVTKVVSKTDVSYPFRAAVTGYAKTGTKSYRLTFPTRYDPFINGVPEQSFRLGRELVPGSAAKLNFQFRRGLMTPASKLAVEYSADGGRTYTVIGTPYPGLGGGGDSAFQTASLPLPAIAGPIRIRFRYYLSDSTSALYSHQDYPTQPTGIFIDDISVSGCDWLESSGSVIAPNLVSFPFNAGTAGVALAAGQEWWLRPRAVLGGKSFPYGPAKIVKPTGPLQLIGPVEPAVTGANYQFIPDPAATSYRFEVAQLASSAWIEGAEGSPAPQITPAVSNYALYSNLKGYRKSGALSFRLGLSTAADAEDMFTINRQVIPSAASALDFWVRRGPMSTTNRIHAEISTDDGATWTSIWNLPGIKKADKAVTHQSVSLAAWADKTIRLRFAIRNAAGGTNLKWNAKTSGVWLDDIAVTSSSSLLSSNESIVPSSATTARLDSLTAGHQLAAGSTLRLRLRTMTSVSAGSWGPPLVVTPTDSPDATLPEGFAGWISQEYPGRDLSFDGDYDHDGIADGIEYAFSLDPTDGKAVPEQLSFPESRIEISRDLPLQRSDISYGAEWTDNLGEWSSEDVEIRTEGGKIIASAPKGTGGRFMRWKIEKE